MLARFKRTVFWKTSITLCLLAILLVFVGGRFSRGESRLYLVLYAFDTERMLLAGQMERADSVMILGRPVLTGRLAGKDVVLAESGLGMTNAAITTQML